jgi:hypothetical protein
VYVFANDESTALSLSKGATSLDGAFAIHSSLGLRTQSIFVNGLPVHFSRPLENGDVISVKCAPEGEITAKASWLGQCVSTNAQENLRRYFRYNKQNMLLAFGCIQLLQTMELSCDRIARRYPNWRASSKLTAAKLAKFARDRTVYSNIGELLLGIVNTGDSGKISQVIGRLLDIPADELTVPKNIYKSLLWVEMQTRNGWKNEHLRSEILVPLMTKILPELGYYFAVNRWVELVHDQDLLQEWITTSKERSAPSKATSFPHGRNVERQILPSDDRELKDIRKGKIVSAPVTTATTTTSSTIDEEFYGLKSKESNYITKLSANANKELSVS